MNLEKGLWELGGVSSREIISNSKPLMNNSQNNSFPVSTVSRNRKLAMALDWGGGQQSQGTTWEHT